MARDYYPAKLSRLDRERRLDEMAAYVGRKQHGQPRFAPLIPADARSALSHERSAARYRRELEVHADAPEPYMALRFWNRGQGELKLTSTLMLHGVPTTFTPFLDPDFVAFIWGLSSEHIDETFHDDVIAVRFPRGNEVPYLVKQQPQPPRAFLREMNRGSSSPCCGRIAMARSSTGAHSCGARPSVWRSATAGSRGAGVLL